MLSDRKSEVERPRLRTRGRSGREVEVDADEVEPVASESAALWCSPSVLGV
jgi:hypothetical protein